jgi:S-adenosylmethionine hydrolase
MMPIISLITDFGTKDYFAGALKGAILKELREVQLMDTCHHVEHFNMVEAAFILRNSYNSFPAETLHIVCVNELEEQQSRHLAVRHNDHYFIGPDNGLFSLAFDEEPELVYELERFREQGSGFGFISGMLAKTAAYILKGGDIRELGKPVFQIQRRTSLAPVVQDNLLRGSVIYIDGFCNAVVNIPRSLFEEKRAGRSFVLFFKRSERITEISRLYSDVAEGEKLCIFNSSDYLEIAINRGKASGLLGLNIGDTVQVDFV